MSAPFLRREFTVHPQVSIISNHLGTSIPLLEHHHPEKMQVDYYKFIDNILLYHLPTLSRLRDPTITPKYIIGPIILGNP